MSSNKVIYAIYNDDDTLMDAVKKTRAAHHHIEEVFTPFPVHGLDQAMGLKETDLHIAGFIYGITGTSTAVGFMSWIFTKDWPINFGGKPHFSLPAFIPITFELTVLFAAVGMVLTFCYLNQIMPGVKKHVFHPRQTDDTFVVAIELSEHTSEAEVLEFLKSTGANETNVQVAESEWWYGRFDKKEAYELS